MKNIIKLYTKDDYAYWAKTGGLSELLLSHLTHGERFIYGADHLKDIKDLAIAHGWNVEIIKE